MREVLTKYFAWELTELKSKAPFIFGSPRKEELDPMIHCEICERKVLSSDMESHIEIYQKLIRNQSKMNEVIGSLKNCLFQVYRLCHLTKLKIKFKLYRFSLVFLSRRMPWNRKKLSEAQKKAVQTMDLNSFEEFRSARKINLVKPAFNHNPLVSGRDIRLPSQREKEVLEENEKESLAKESQEPESEFLKKRTPEDEPIEKMKVYSSSEDINPWNNKSLESCQMNFQTPQKKPIPNKTVSFSNEKIWNNNSSISSIPDAIEDQLSKEFLPSQRTTRAEDDQLSNTPMADQTSQGGSLNQDIFKFVLESSTELIHGAKMTLGDLELRYEQLRHLQRLNSHFKMIIKAKELLINDSLTDEQIFKSKFHLERRQPKEKRDMKLHI